MESGSFFGDEFSEEDGSPWYFVYSIRKKKCLINTGDEFTNNCSCLRTVIGDCVRVIIYTSKVIKAGEQLLYSYGPNYCFRSYYQGN